MAFPIRLYVRLVSDCFSVGPLARFLCVYTRNWQHAVSPSFSQRRQWSKLRYRTLRPEIG